MNDTKAEEIYIVQKLKNLPNWWKKLSIANKIQLVVALISIFALIISIVSIYLTYDSQTKQVLIQETQTQTQREQTDIQRRLLGIEENQTNCNREVADDFFKKGEFREAEILYDRMLKNCPSPNRPYFLKYKGLALLNIGINNETAKIVQESPITSAESVIKYALNYTPSNINQNFSIALICFREAYGETGNFEFVFYEAITNLYLGELWKSIESFNNTINIINKTPSKYRNRVHNNTLYMAWYGISIAYQKMGDEEKAIEAVNKANETK